MDDLTPAYLGARLARMRLQLGQSRREEITQRRLAQALNIKPQAYNSWEQGKALPRLDHLWRLARYYRVSLDRLCGYERDAEATGGIEWTSLRRVLDAMPDAATVWPGHDYGARPSSTIALEKETNPFLRCGDVEAFLQMKRDWPTYKKRLGLK